MYIVTKMENGTIYQMYNLFYHVYLAIVSVKRVYFSKL